MEIRVLVFNSGTYERADLAKKTEQELYELWQQDDKSGMAQVQCYTLDEFSEAFNDEEVSDQDWLYFIDIDNCTDSEGPLASYSKTYRDGIAYVMANLDDDDKAIIRAECNKAYKMHLVPNGNIVDDAKIIDLLEEYGADNDLPEGWYLEEYDADEVLAMI